MYDVIVVGAGIMGATIGQAYRNQGRKVLIVDDSRPMAGTSPSGGAIKPSKLTGLNSEDEEAAIQTLRELYGLEEIQFEIKPTGGFVKVSTYQLNMDKVFDVETEGDIAQCLEKGPAVKFQDMGVVQAKLVVVATGIWASELLPEVFDGKMEGKTGVSFLFEGRIKQPFVKPWAPYKQITIHNYRLDGRNYIWASDGSALKSENWTEERTNQCKERCMSALGITKEPVEVTLGIRPFHKDKPKPCFLKEVRPNVWAATGAGKFGCISAGWAANQMLRVG